MLYLGGGTITSLYLMLTTTTPGGVCVKMKTDITDRTERRENSASLQILPYSLCR